MPYSSNSPENFPERLNVAMDAFCEKHPAFRDAQGEYGGMYSFSRNKSTVNIGVRTFGNVMDGNAEIVSVPIGTALPTDTQQEHIRNAVQTIMAQHGFIPNPHGRAPDRELAKKMIGVRVGDIMRADKAFEHVPAAEKGLFFTRINLGMGGKKVVVFSFYPQTDVVAARTRYIHSPHEVIIPLVSSEMDEARQVQAYGQEAMREMGFQQGDLRTGKPMDREVPKGWIELKKVTLHNSGKKNHSLILVNKNAEKRLPRITVSTSLTDAEQASCLQEAFCKEFLPLRLAEGGMPITLKDAGQWIRQWVKTQGYAYGEPEKAVQHKLPPIVITNPQGEVKCRMMMPQYNLHNGMISLHIAPPSSVRSYPSAIAFSAGSSIKSLLAIRKTILRYVAAAILKEYFSQHPDAEILTSDHETTEKGCKVMGIKPQAQPAPSYALLPMAQAVHSRLEGGDEENALIVHIAQVIENARLNKMPDARAIEHMLKAALAENNAEMSPVEQSIGSAIKAFRSLHPQYRLWRGEGGDIKGLEVDRGRYMDMRYVRDAVLEPALRGLLDNQEAYFPRLIMWHAHIEPAGQLKQKAQHLVLNAICNPLTAFPERASPPWDHTVTLEADSLEHARQCDMAIQTHLYEHQLTGIRRPVPHFGVPSQAVVLRESLKAGLACPGINIWNNQPGKHVLQELQREARREKGRERENKI